MDPQKLLKSLEGAVFEMALWVLLLPKTLLQVLRRPVWVFDYTTAELAKPEADRFDDYLSPVSFWLLLAVGPYLWGASVVRHRYSPPGDASGDVISHLPIINRYLITALLLVAAPLTVAVIFSLIRGHGLARRVLQPHFAVQCYLQTPALLGVMPIVVALLFAPHAAALEHFRGSLFIIGFAGASIIWLLTAETRYLVRDLKTDARRAFRIAAGGLALSALIVACLALTTAHILHTAHLLLPPP
ncbi:MAG TPA: hypothetical protein VEL75_12655 [Candidatus Methylomirabilis sp.]|nr:hypothetical protein [Candidatus Methylomirabilis sp.]